MLASGAFTKDNRFELIEGTLVAKMTKKPRHSTGSELCGDAVRRLLPPGWHVRIEKPVRIPARDSMPEPDISVARGQIRDYEERDPGPVDVALVVEVSDTTLAADRRGEPRYCRGRALTYGGGTIPVYWIVNVADRQLEVYSNPADGAYPAPIILGETDSVDLVIEGVVVGQIAVSDLLPRPQSGGA
jgi:Uma2 family endonuclease